MTNQFCPRLTHQLECSYSSNYLAVKPCCRFKNNIAVRSQADFEKARKTLDSINAWSENCEFCLEEESAGFESYRQRAFRKLSFSVEPCQGLAVLVVTVGNECNAACLSCNATDSNMWVKFNEKHGLTSNFDNIRTPLRTDKLLELVNPQSLTELRELSFIGGEPFYSKTHKEWMHLLVDVADTSKIKLKYITNGSILPDSETQLLWKKFGGVTVLFSVDATGDQFHYLRWPLQWHNFERTVDWFLNQETTSFIGFNCTVGLMNLLGAHRLADWVDNYFMPRYARSKRDSYSTILGFNPCRHEIGLDKITPQMRDHYLKLHDSDHRLNNLTLMVRALNLPEIIVPDTKTMNYINNIDRLRNLSWPGTFPELVPFLQ